MKSASNEKNPKETIDEISNQLQCKKYDFLRCYFLALRIDEGEEMVSTKWAVPVKFPRPSRIRNPSMPATASHMGFEICNKRINGHFFCLIFKIKGHFFYYLK
jgi:hypothetical protein